MKRLAKVQPQLQTATVLKFKRPVNVFTQENPVETAEIAEIRRLNKEYKFDLHMWVLNCDDEDDLRNVMGFIEHLKTEKARNPHPHISLVASKRSGIN